MEQRSPLQPTMPEKPLGIPLRTGSAYKTLQRLGDGKEEEEEGRREGGGGGGAVDVRFELSSAGQNKITRSTSAVARNGKFQQGRLPSN